MSKRRLFTVRRPLGYRVILTRDRWREIIRYKHPALGGHDAEVRDCLRDPEYVRESVKDPGVHLYYRSLAGRFICVAVAGADAEEWFVVTAYLTKKIKRGRELWTK